MEGFNLLLSLHARVVESLVLLLDPTDFSLNLLLPFGVLKLASLVVLVLELPNLFKLILLFDLKACLLDRFVEEDVEDRLYFYVVLEQVVVFDLGDLVDTGFLWDVLWSGGLRLEYISLQFHFSLLGFGTSLLSQEVSKVDFDAGRWTWSKIIWRCGIFRLFEFYQLRFDHLDLFLFPLFFDSLLLFL